MLMKEDMNECGKKNSTSFTLTVKSHSRPDCILPHSCGLVAPAGQWCENPVICPP